MRATSHSTGKTATAENIGLSHRSQLFFFS